MKKRYLFIIFIGTSVWAVPPVISPSTAVVSARQTIQFSAQNSVNWSLAAGSAGSITAGGLYTAPSLVTPHNVVAGCQLGANDDIANVRIDSLPVDANSTNRINNVADIKLSFEIAMPLNIVDNTTPTTVLHPFYTTENDGVSFPLLAFPYNGVENAATPNNYFAQDRHQHGVNKDTCQFIELYNKYPTGTNGANQNANIQSAIKYWGMSYALPDAGNGGGSTDAAGTQMQKYLPHYSEIKAGVINHALRFTLANGYEYNGLLWPATAFTNQCQTLSTCFPYGARLRLKAGFQIGHYSKTAQIYLLALQHYGMINADGGTTFAVQTSADVAADTTTWYAFLNEIIVSTISKSNFEQVDESSLMVSSFTSNVNLNNPYMTPDLYASVIATNQSDQVASTQAIPIQGVGIGFKNVPYTPNNAAISVMAGTPAFQIPVIITGSSDPTTTCTMSPTLGTLTAGCLYTAPASQVNLLSSTTVTITPKIDTTQAFSFPLVVYPSDGIRVRLGPKSGANSPAPTYDAAGDLQDAAGKWWWDDPIGNNMVFYSRDDDYSPQSSWGSATDVNLFYTAAHGTSDGVFSMMVPNGNYTLSMGFASDGNNNSVTASSASIDSQGIILLSTTSLVHQSYNPNTLSYPIQVTNNQFYWALREVSSTQFPLISKWSLIFNSPLAGTSQSQSWQGGILMKGGVTGQ